MQITAIILSGGQSTRMGTDKAFLQINGMTLLERAIQACKPVCKQLLISSGNPEHETGGLRVIPDEILDCGPLGGIYSCLKESETEWNFVISVDSAYVDNFFISFLVSETGGFDAIVPMHQNGKEPLVALYNKSALNEMEKMLLSQNYKMHNLLNLINTKYVSAQPWIEKNPDLFRNLNFPADL